MPAGREDGPGAAAGSGGCQRQDAAVRVASATLQNGVHAAESARAAGRAVSDGPDSAPAKGPTETVDLDAPPAPPEELTLAGEFPAAAREQWEKLVAGVLDKSGARGLAPSDAAEKLTVTVGGIPIQGIYSADDVESALPDPGFPGSAPFVRGSPSAGHPRRLGRARDVQQSGSGRDPRAGPDRPRERRHVALAFGRRLRLPAVGARRRARGRPARPGARRARRGWRRDRGIAGAARGRCFPRRPGRQPVGQPRSRPGGTRRPHRRRTGARGGGRVRRRSRRRPRRQRHPAAHHRRRRPALPRGRRHRGARARRVARVRGRLPAGTRRRRAVTGDRDGAAGVSLRGD